MDDHELNFASSLRHDSSSKTLESDSSERMNRRKSKVSILHFAAFVFVLGFCFLVAGVVLITLSQTRTSETQKNSAFNQTIDSKENYTFGENKTVTESRCAFSSGGQLAGRCHLCDRCLVLKCFAGSTSQPSLTATDLFRPSS